VWLCNAARCADPVLDAAFAAADAGWTLVTYPDVGSLDPTGGPRPKESRDLLAAKLPFERTRQFGVPVTKLRVVRALEGTSTKRGRELDVAPVADQGVFLGSAHPGAEVLAEWFESSSPAFIVAPRGSGRVLMTNGSPGLTRPSLIPDVLTHLRVGTSRPRPQKVEEPRRDAPSEPRMLGRLGLIPDPPYEIPPPAQLIAPPEFAEGLTVGEAQSAFDATVVGPWGAVAALGPRPAGAEAWLRFRGVDLLLAAWDWAFVGPDRLLTTGREARVRAGAYPSRYAGEPDGWVRSIYRPGAGQAVCPSAGLYKLEDAKPDHALVGTGGARVVRAERLHGEDALLVEVDRPGLLEIQLDPEASAGKKVDVTLALGDGPSGVRLGPSQWWITSDDVLLVDALARVPIKVTFAKVEGDAERATCSLRPLAGAREVLMDGWSAVLLDRYANSGVELTFERWARPASINVLALTAAKGDLYGRDGPSPDAPTHLRVTANGRTVYNADAPLRTCRSDGATEEWAALAIPIPPDALRRGANVIVVRNEGPNAVFLHAASLRFEEPPAEQ
jgi:hypothetical protein